MPEAAAAFAANVGDEPLRAPAARTRARTGNAVIDIAAPTRSAKPSSVTTDNEGRGPSSRSPTKWWVADRKISSSTDRLAGRWSISSSMDTSQGWERYICG
jgi:hypothetical protein